MYSLALQDFLPRQHYCRRFRAMQSFQCHKAQPSFLTDGDISGIRCRHVCQRVATSRRQEMHVRSTAGNTTAKTPPRPCSAVSSANRGACTRLTKEPRTRSPVSGSGTLTVLPCSPSNTRSLPQPDSSTTTVSVNTSHVVANIYQPIMTRPAKGMRFLLGSHKHQHHHHNA